MHSFPHRCPIRADPSSGDFPQPLIMESGVEHFRLNVPDIFEQWATTTQSTELAALEPRSVFQGSLPSPAVSAVRIEESGILDEPPSQLPSPPYLQPPERCPEPVWPEIETSPFTQEPHPEPFEFQVNLQLPIRFKRPRARHDVDGYYTAVLSCKKRRLRTELITSRLSQPFSLPATHIINREAIAAGDKRFMKLAASVEAHKRCPSTQSSMVRRAALLNSTRQRVQGELHEREQGFLRVAVHETNMLHRGQHASTGGRFLAVAAPSGSTSPTTRVIIVRTPGSMTAPGPHGPNQTRSATISPLGGTEAVQRRLVKSPLLRPARSPILGPSDARLDEVADDDETAFPEDDRRYTSADDDDSDDVYSDFGAIFGGAGREDDPLDSEENSYEGYLDELDGISWVGR
ncbi:hypothetical protein F5X68DRAFT_44507 [Plectosphaerella plurivora]|uniref:Uncharacterized protein n=1 Tax=Plectosphaerella plurivora TaxID=936078 RepID=A0A9P8V3J9_9PEZI|nr:hypothetical protein F5X68DRAFT_44507 [Plectosphaerella plurivora]